MIDPLLTLSLYHANISINSKFNKFYNSYPEWLRDWPDDARQPSNNGLKGANSCKANFALKDERDKCNDIGIFGLSAQSRGAFLVSIKFWKEGWNWEMQFHTKQKR